MFYWDCWNLSVEIVVQLPASCLKCHMINTCNHVYICEIIVLFVLGKNIVIGDNSEQMWITMGGFDSSVMWRRRSHRFSLNCYPNVSGSEHVCTEYVTQWANWSPADLSIHSELQVRLRTILAYQNWHSRRKKNDTTFKWINNHARLQKIKKKCLL